LVNTRRVLGYVLGYLVVIYVLLFVSLVLAGGGHGFMWPLGIYFLFCAPASILLLPLALMGEDGSYWKIVPFVLSPFLNAAIFLVVWAVWFRRTKQRGAHGAV